MAGYSPLKITGNSTGLVQERENFLLPDDAYPILQNAYVWREKIKRKRGYQLLGRLQRNFSNVFFGPNTTTGQIQILGFYIYISNISQAVNAVITTASPNPLTTGLMVAISNVVGMTQINNLTSTITVLTPTTFQVSINTTGFSPYVSGGIVASNNNVGTVEPYPTVVPGSVIVTISPINIVYTDNGLGQLIPNGAVPTGTINYSTGVALFGLPLSTYNYTTTFSYYPNLPVMGIRTEEAKNSANNTTIFFDQVYAYIFNSSTNLFGEFITGTTWNTYKGAVTATDFFWSTNFWVSSTPIFTSTNLKLFWVTNNTGAQGVNQDPVRITDGISWVNFNSGTWNQIDATNFLTNFLSMLPFRGRMVVFNTFEGISNDGTGSQNFPNRVRWSTIGNPFIAYNNGPPAKGSWRDDIRGQGGFLDIPTSEDIVAVGFVRDNLVIYCERSTWQLRYTGRSIAPFQIERVNSEIGAQGPLSAVQFDTSLLAIGDKGIINCDSYKADRVDVKIPDLVFTIQSSNNGPFRVHGIRDFVNRLAYWTYPDSSITSIFPSTRLVYNYENDSWALFTDSLTALGNYQSSNNQTWINTFRPWIECNFPWVASNTAEIPLICGGNQQGFVEIISGLNGFSTNDVSLFIISITANTTTPTQITSNNHNMQTGFVIEITSIPAGSPFANLNGGVFGIVVTDADTFSLYKYNSTEMKFSTPQVDVPTTPYIGGGLIKIRENFSIISKKFNFLDEGQSIQMGYLDILMGATGTANPGAMSLNVYIDYDDANSSNIIPQNQINNGNQPAEADTFFNSIIPTTPSTLAGASEGSKFWQRVFCATRANFLTLQYTLSNAQMNGVEQQQDVQIDAQVLWIRKAGRLTQL